MTPRSHNDGNKAICLDPAEISPARVYHTLNAVVVPRPIAFVTSQNESEIVNAAPFSWFGALCADPPLISISVARRKEQLKDTAHNILDSREFVVNICSVEMADGISKAAGDWDPTISEVDLAGFKQVPSVKVTPPRIAESPVQMECRLHRHLELGNGPLDFIIGEVVLFHVSAEVCDDDGRIDVSRIRPLARLNGDNYARLDPDFFSVPRG